MHSSASSRSAYLSIALCLFLAGCPPTAASCPTGFQLTSDGRCVAATDGGTGGDGSVGPDTGVLPMTDAGVGPDGCALHTYYADTDGDGFGDASATMFACEMPAGYAAMGTDCDDTCATCHPGATEVCEGARDEDCDGTVDQPSACSCTTGMTRACGASSTAPCHMGTQMCTAGTWGACTGNVEPMAELCNGVDDDCNGMVDDGITLPTWHVDADGDGHGSATGTTMMACAMPSGYVASSDDCNDAAATDYPGNTEICDGVDNDCSGAPDDATSFTCVRGAATACTSACGTAGTGFCSATCGSPTGASCTPPAEMCNGADDNCNGAADDGLAMVGTASCLGSGCTVGTPTRVSPHIVALTSGFGVVWTSSTQDQFYWQLVQANGTPMGSVIPLGTAAHPRALGPAQFDVAFDGTNVIIAFTHEATGDYGAFLHAFAPATGATVYDYTIPMPSGRNADYLVQFAGVATNRASVYVQQVNTTTSVHYVRRYRFNTLGSAPSLLAQLDAVTDLKAISNGGAWAALATNGYDVVAYRNNADDLAMVYGPTGDTAGGAFAGTATPITTATAQPNILTIALAIRSPSSAVSATNPIGLAWQRDAGNGTYVAQLTSVTSSSTLSTPVQLMGSRGAPNVFGLAHWLTLFAVPSSSSYMNVGQFYVVSVEDDSSVTSSSVGTVSAWEVVGGNTPTALSVPGEVSHTRYDISVAMSGTSIRLAEENATGDVVTRQLGCR